MQRRFSNDLNDQRSGIDSLSEYVNFRSQSKILSRDLSVEVEQQVVMDIDWGVMLIGLLVIVFAVIRGRLVVAINPEILAFSWVTIGILGGIVTGFLAGGTVISRAVHGGIMTVLASLLNLVVVTFATIFFAGFVPEYGVLLFAFYR